MTKINSTTVTVLVGLKTVRAMRGITAEAVMKIVERGELKFVFNLASPGCRKLRALRFWLPEVVDPRAVAKLKIETVVSMILPRESRSISCSEICKRFTVCRPTVHRWRVECGGVIKNRVLYIERDALAKWLRRRWIGGGK